MAGKSLKTRLQEVESRIAPDLAAVWIYCGFAKMNDLIDGGGGVWRIGIPHRPSEIPPGTLVMIRDEEYPDEALSRELSDLVLSLLELNKRQRLLLSRAPKIVLISANPGVGEV